MKKLLFVFLISGLLTVVCGPSYADTINLKDGGEVKGIVVEDYTDRVVISTIDGERSIMKKEISHLYFDTEDDNLIKLAEAEKARGDYQKAYAYYYMAFKANPNSKPAKDGLVFLQGYLFRKDEIRKEEDVKMREEYERRGPMVATILSDEDTVKEYTSKLKKTIGIILKAGTIAPAIENVIPNSAAADAGIRRGDLIVSIWGRLTGYMSLKDVMAVLLEKPTLEIKCAIERTIKVDVDRSGTTGASFSMEFDGLTVSGVKEDSPAFAAGIKKGDLLTTISGKSTRYMPLKVAVDMIKKLKRRTIDLTFRREVTIWRRD